MIGAIIAKKAIANAFIFDLGENFKLNWSSR